MGLSNFPWAILEGFWVGMFDVAGTFFVPFVSPTEAF
jgi:hypothetical protein